MSRMIAIGIPSYQRRDQLARLLESVADSYNDAVAEIGDGQVEVIVVLDGSTDGSDELLKALAATFPVPLRSVWKENGGLASARNAIVDSADSELIWFIDDDMTVTPAALVHHWTHDRSDASVLMGPCVVADGSADLDEMRSFYAARHERLAGRRSVTVPSDCSFANTSAPRSLLLAERFDERYRGYGMEDYDLAARLLDLAVTITFEPAAAIVHHPVLSRSERLTKLREEGANRLRFANRHPAHRHISHNPRPARFERLVHLAARPALSTPLWRVGALVDRISSHGLLRRHRQRLHYWADTCAVYSGMSAHSASDHLRVTVIIAARDAADTIGDALDSLRCQTSGEWDAVVVDDGSTDSTADVVADFARRDSRVSLLRQDNQGVSAARNVGCRAATSRWLLFLDADDRISCAFIERMQQALREDGSAAGVRCNWGYETDDGRVETVVNHDLDGGSDLFTACAEHPPFAIHACVIRADVVERVGGFDPTLRVGEDWDLWQRIARSGAYLLSVPETMAFYRLRANSAMHVDDPSAIFDVMTVFRRTHSEDDRVPDATPSHRGGAALDPSRDVVAEWAAWTMGVGIPFGGHAVDALPARIPQPNSWLDPDVVAGTLHEAVPFSCCALASDWPKLWSTYEEAIRRDLHDYETWCGHPHIAQRVMRHLERMVARQTSGTEPVHAGSTLGVRIDVDGEPEELDVPDGVDRIVANITAGADVTVGTAELPAFELSLKSDDLRSAVRRQLAPTLARRQLRRPATALAFVRSNVDRRRLAMLARFSLDLPRDDLRASRDLARRFARAATRPMPDFDPPSDVGSDSPVPVETEADDPNGTDYFEQIFSAEDPWAYTSDYEQTKYEQTLSLLDDLDPVNALELACAEGHFTLQLAPLVGRLIAADISPTAISRAAERCASVENAEFRVIDLRDGALPTGQDLIVCSEVLYFLDDDHSLAAMADRIAMALTTGGHFLTAHAKVTEDDSTKTGFTWARFGAKRIGEILSASDRLVLDRAIETPLYSICLYRRIEPDDTASAPSIEHRDHGVLDRDLHRSVAWGGVATTRSEAMESEITARLPILMYHRIADSGVAELDRYRVDLEQFESQLDHLRRHGYYGVTADRWRFAMAQRRALPGRAVMLTFDDGYRDFLDNAFPLLDAYGFSATVFVVPELVGSRSSWDAHYGETSPLLTWDEIRWLTEQGIEFASHSGTHVALDGMNARAVRDQETQARSNLEQQLRRPATAIAYPFGVHDATIRETMRSVGYRLGFTCETGLATVWDEPFRLPRIEIRGDDDHEAFRANLPTPTRRNPLNHPIARIRYGSRQVLSRRN